MASTSRPNPIFTKHFRGTSGIQGDAGWVFTMDPKSPDAPFTDARIKQHWDITGKELAESHKAADALKYVLHQ